MVLNQGMAIDESKAREIIYALHSAVTITKTLQKYDVHPQEFYSLINKIPSLFDEYERAQKIRAEMLADEIIDIADNAENPNHARNQIDVRKWAASKMRPEKYGERIDLNVNQTVDIKLALDDAKNRFRQVIELSNVPLELPTGEIPVETIAAPINMLDKLLE